jgi:hypothetical protein
MPETEWSRERAVDRIADLVATVESETMPVPVREVWVYGDVALGLDPVERVDVYLTKDILLDADDGREQEFVDAYGIEGVGKTVRAAWADEHPDALRATAGGYAAPEQCLGAHLLDADEPVHLEVCNAGFEDNVTQRLAAARARGEYEESIDPRGVCLWAEGQHATEALDKLRAGEYVFPTLPDALGMLGLDDEEAHEAARAIKQFRGRQEGRTVRGDIV